MTGIGYGQRQMLRALDRAGAHDAITARTPAYMCAATGQDPDSAKAVLRSLAGRGLAGREQDARGFWAYWLTTAGLEAARAEAAA